MNIPCDNEYGTIIGLSEMTLADLHYAREKVIQKLAQEKLKDEIENDKYYNGKQIMKEYNSKTR